MRFRNEMKTYEQYWEDRNNHTLTHYMAEEGRMRNYFIDNALIRPNDLVDSYDKPSFTDFLQLTHIGFSSFPADFKFRKAFYTDDERLVCQVVGSERFALVSPVYT